MLAVVGVEAVGAYTLVRVERGSLAPGVPGQFFMVEAPGASSPGRSRSARPREASSGSSSTRSAPALRRSRGLETGDRIAVFGPLGNGFRLDVPRPLLVGGGIGIAPFPYLSEALEHPPAILGFRSARHAEAAALVPNAEVVIDPVFVTDAMPTDRDVLACGPEPMLEAVRALVPGAQLAWEAPMACGYGACYGCVVPVDGELVRLCVEGPVFAPPERERLPRRAHGPGGRALARRLRDEDGDARAAGGEPSRPDRRDRARDAQLDRPREPRTASASSAKRSRVWLGRWTYRSGSPSADSRPATTPRPASS